MRTSKSIVLAAMAIAAALVPGTSSAQLKGHYVPGFTGLQSGSQGPPSITIVMPLFFYTTDTLKDDQGQTLGQHPRINSSFLGPGVLWVTNVKLFGGNLGGQIIPADWMKARIEGPSLDVPGSFNFSDIYIQPLQLGWERPRADFVAGWGFFIPTGKWELGGDDNGGLGMWSHDFQAGTTVRLDNRRAWTASVLGTYEIHSKKKDVDLRAIQGHRRYRVGADATARRQEGSCVWRRRRGQRVLAQAQTPLDPVDDLRHGIERPLPGGAAGAPRVG
jgi:hypothetical protein